MNHSPMFTHLLTKQKFYPKDLVPYMGGLWIVKDCEPTDAEKHAFRYRIESLADRETWRTCSEEELVRDICSFNS